MLATQQPMIMGFIDTMRADGHAVESIWRVMSEQGCQVAASDLPRLELIGRPGRPVAARTLTDAQVIDAVRETCPRTDETGCGDRPWKDFMPAES